MATPGDAIAAEVAVARRTWYDRGMGESSGDAAHARPGPTADRPEPTRLDWEICSGFPCL